MLKIIPSFMVSSIFTSKPQVVPISLLKTIASNIFKGAHTHPNLSLTLQPKIFGQVVQNLVVIILVRAHLKPYGRKKRENNTIFLSAML